MRKIETTVQTLRHSMRGPYKNVELHHSRDGRVGGYIFAKFPSGEVRVIHHSGLDLSRKGSWVNDQDRRCYARIAGIAFKDLRAAIKAEQDAQEKQRNSSTFRHLEKMAAKAGYRLVKGAE